MSLTSQLITDAFLIWIRVEKLNKEAFPRKNEFLYQSSCAIRTERTPTFAFYNQEEFVGFAFTISNPKPSISVFCHYAPLESHGYGKKSSKS